MKIHIGEMQVMKLLSDGLVLIGYPDNLKIHCHISDNNRPRYYFVYSDDCGTKYLKTFGVKEAINIIQNMMWVNRCEKTDIGIDVNNGNVSYFVKLDFNSKNKQKIKKR